MKYEIGEKEFLGKKKKTIYIEDFKLQITFSEDAKGIEFLEVSKQSFIHNGTDLSKLKFDEVQNIYSILDEQIKIEEDGFETQKFGFGVSRKLKDGEYTNQIDSLFAFSKEYSESEEDYDLDDIIKFYLDE